MKNKLTISQLKNEIKALYNELETRLSESEIEEFFLCLRSDSSYFSHYDNDGIAVYKNFKL